MGFKVGGLPVPQRGTGPEDLCKYDDAVSGGCVFLA